MRNLFLGIIMVLALLSSSSVRAESEDIILLSKRYPTVSHVAQLRLDAHQFDTTDCSLTVHDCTAKLLVRNGLTEESAHHLPVGYAVHVPVVVPPQTRAQIDQTEQMLGDVVDRVNELTRTNESLTTERNQLQGALSQAHLDIEGLRTQLEAARNENARKEESSQPAPPLAAENVAHVEDGAHDQAGWLPVTITLAVVLVVLTIMFVRKSRKDAAEITELRESAAQVAQLESALEGAREDLEASGRQLRRSLEKGELLRAHNSDIGKEILRIRLGLARGEVLVLLGEQLVHRVGSVLAPGCERSIDAREFVGATQDDPNTHWAKCAKCRAWLAEQQVATETPEGGDESPPAPPADAPPSGAPPAVGGSGRMKDLLGRRETIH